MSHLKEINETYFEHMRFAQKWVFRMALAGVALLVHSIFPNIFVTTASDIVKKWDEEMLARKNKDQMGL
ncbi:MAG TPA: DUF6356 family protein [Gammaproteobacteria bacterium]|nr:DUF6356 family protein [Gammaproteobacteria bacterium]